ncbi:MAG: hypothetical protein ACJAS1_000549 [Oleiphilaceae bacterium]|jgi:hypothetical protein
MKLELKNIKVFKGIGLDGYAFTSSFYAENKKVGVISNSGGGEPVDFEGNEEIYIKVKRYLNSLPSEVFKGKEIHQDIESFCCEKINEHLKMKEFESAIKKTILFREAGNNFLMQQPLIGVKKIEQRHLDAFRKRHPNRVVLNDMRIDKALALFEQ